MPHLDHIWIKIDMSVYAINSMLNQLVSKTTLNKIVIKANLSQWHLVAFFLRKMILAKT